MIQPNNSVPNKKNDNYMDSQPKIDDTILNSESDHDYWENVYKELKMYMINVFGLIFSLFFDFYYIYYFYFT